MSGLRLTTIDVLLTEAESRIATWTGKQRRADAIANERDCGLGASSLVDDAGFHIRGAHAEYATSIALNLFWRPTIGLIHEKDVGGLVQVRSIDDPRFSLVVKPKDCDEDPFVLVLQLSRLEYRLLGWLFADQVKRDYPLRFDRGDPGHYAPNNQLNDMASLLDWIASARLASTQGVRQEENA
jgi:hypothetical protein